mgnify:CR=1 FL=1
MVIEEFALQQLFNDVHRKARTTCFRKLTSDRLEGASAKFMAKKENKLEKGYNKLFPYFEKFQ